MADRGRETGRALTEVRTVLSRAETARQDVARFYSDPEGNEMLAALDDVIRKLERWRRTGRTKYQPGQYR